MKRNDVIFLTSAVVLVVAVVAFGFWTLGSPLRQRQAAWDSKRVADLGAIAAEIHAQWTRKDGTQARELPAKLSELVSAPGAQPVRLQDPVTGQPYEYMRLEGSAYRLCATFARASNEYRKEAAGLPPSFWDHPRERHCFVLDAARDVAR